MKLIIFSVIFLYVLQSHAVGLPKQYRDYKVSHNIDSLENAVYAMDSNSEVYLHELIQLENSRFKNSNNFSKDFLKIEKLLKKYNSKLAQAAYNILSVDLLLDINKVKSAKLLYESEKYFLKTKDTTGLIATYYRLLKVNVSSFWQENGDKKIAESYLLTIEKLAEASNFIPDKVRANLYKISFGSVILKSFTYQAQLALANSILTLVKKNPEIDRDHYLVAGVFTNLGTRNFLNKNYPEAHKNFRIAYQLRKDNHSFFKAGYCHNLAFVLYQLRHYDEAYIYAKEGVDLLKYATGREEELFINLLEVMAMIQHHRKEYNAAWTTLERRDSLKAVHQEHNRSNEVLEYQLKYDSEIKAERIKTLENERMLTEQKRKNTLYILTIVIIAFLIIGLLSIKLQRNLSQLNRLIRNRDRFFTIIAHDLKSPLNAYQNLVDVLSFYLKKKEYSKLEQVSGLIDKNGAKLSILVDNLLNWGLAQDSKIILKPGLINIGEFILDLLPVYQLIANNKGVNLKHNFDENISVITDSNSLSIIIRNLLDNALKFSNPNSNVEIKLNKWENGVEIGVLNSFNPSTLHRVQEIKAFFTGNTNKTSGESEFGLGLVLIKRFARYNNIQISVTDTPAFELLFVLKLFTVK